MQRRKRIQREGGREGEIELGTCRKRDARTRWRGREKQQESTRREEEKLVQRRKEENDEEPRVRKWATLSSLLPCFLSLSLILHFFLEGKRESKERETETEKGKKEREKERKKEVKKDSVRCMFVVLMSHPKDAGRRDMKTWGGRKSGWEEKKDGERVFLFPFSSLYLALSLSSIFFRFLRISPEENLEEGRRKYPEKVKWRERESKERKGRKERKKERERNESKISKNILLLIFLFLNCATSQKMLSLSLFSLSRWVLYTSLLSFSPSSRISLFLFEFCLLSNTLLPSSFSSHFFHKQVLITEWGKDFKNCSPLFLFFLSLLSPYFFLSRFLFKIFVRKNETVMKELTQKWGENIYFLSISYFFLVSFLKFFLFCFSLISMVSKSSRESERVRSFESKIEARSSLRHFFFSLIFLPFHFLLSSLSFPWVEETFGYKKLKWNQWRERAKEKRKTTERKKGVKKK